MKAIPLGSVCSIERKQALYNALPYIGMEDIEQGTAKFIGPHENRSVQSTTFKFTENHFLFGRLRPYLKKIFCPNFSGHCSTEIIPFLPSKELDRFYLKYWMLQDSIVDKINLTCTGTRMPRASIDSVFKLKINICHLKEQRRIVTILDDAFERIDKVIENTEKNIANAKELFDGYLKSIFSLILYSYGGTTLENVCTLKNGFAFKSNSFRAAGIPVLRISSIQNEEICENRPVFAVQQDYREDLSRYIVSDGDLLIAMSGATTGKVGINKTGNIYYLNQRVGKLVPSKQLHIDFLFFYLLMRQEESLKISLGSAQPNLSSKQINEFVIPLPPHHVQKQYVETLLDFREKTQSINEVYALKLASLRALKQSLLAAAFSGELTADFNPDALEL